jgi:quercetin dioxygenase-like cupin family protein
MKFPRIHADEQGVTHIGVLDVPEHEARVGPPPNPVGQMTETEAVSTFVVFSAPAGTNVPPHNAPQPYICIVLAGEGEVVTSDGKTLRLRAGELIYCDDTSGQGHVTRVITDVRLAFINRVKA